MCRGVGHRRGAACANDRRRPSQNGGASSSCDGWLGWTIEELRVGAPRTITDEAVEAIIVKTLKYNAARRDP